MARDEMIELVEGVDDDVDILGAIEDLVGAAARPAARGGARGAATFRGMQIRRAPPVMSSMPAGVQTGPTGKILPVPFSVANFTGAAVIGALTARPQMPVRGKRLILNATGDTAAAQLIANGAVVTSIMVGAQPVFPNAGAVPVTAFGPTATDTQLLLPNAAPGIEIVINVALPAGPGADNVTISATLFSEAVS